MGTFDINETIITHQSNTNIYNGEVLDHERLRTLWELIIEENEAQKYSVKESEWLNWVILRDRVNRYLESADTPHTVITALEPVRNMIAEREPKVDEYLGYLGIRRGSCVHVPHDEIKRVNNR